MPHAVTAVSPETCGDVRDDSRATPHTGVVHPDGAPLAAPRPRPTDCTPARARASLALRRFAPSVGAPVALADLSLIHISEPTRRS
eukprot:6698250-Prymnesium_polylepis.1